MINIVSEPHVILWPDGCRIPASRRPEERKYQIGAFRNTPTRKRQPQIRVMLSQVHLAGHIEQPTNTQGTIDRETAPVLTDMIPAPLQHAVKAAAKVPQILVKAGDGIVHPLRGGFLVPLCYRFQAVGIEKLIEREYLAVHVLPRVGVLVLPRRRVKRRSGLTPVILFFRCHQHWQAQQYC